jgi:sorbitol-specific phosphotransferase system component IIBC
MQTVRIVGTVFLSLALILGLVATFIPTGETWIEAGGARTTQTYDFWSQQESGTTDATTGWFEAANDDTAGITLLRASAVLWVVGLLGLAIALVLTAVRATTDTAAGGVVAALGFVAALLALLLHAAGLMLRAEGFAGAGSALLTGTGMVLAAATVTLLLVAALLGMRSSGAATRAEATYARPTGARRLMCPKCHNINEAPFGALPVCYSCGYSS